MKVILKLKDESYVNIPADCIDYRDEFIMAWNGEALVVIAKADNVELCYLTEKGGGDNGRA